MLNQAKFVLQGLTVKKENMKRNLGISQGWIMAEPLMLALAKRTGKKETGYAMIHKAAMESLAKGIPFEESIQGFPEIHKYFTPEEIRGLLEPQNYLGLTDRLINDVISKK
jgi:adenylosuccinate lyase